MAEKYDLIQMGEQALTAKYEASLLTTEQKNTVLTEIAQNLRKDGSARSQKGLYRSQNYRILSVTYWKNSPDQTDF